ncbi:MAG: tRNA (guanine(46)-N(7))-methyltransferase TrmB [Neomegalonema sp.]|nr:tRNA (guanine(46)-N(7))-methyltransferase TrmB [Neomegalonema sp.]
MTSLLPALSVPGVRHDENPGRSKVDLGALFGPVEDVWLEIGFGGGEHLLALAKAHPELGLIGSEHYVDGVAKFVAAIEREGVENIRLHAHDARDLMDVLPDAGLGRAYLLYPDPWPKLRHHKRRFINPENLDQFARILRPGAELRVASDIPDYIRHTLQQVMDHGAFEWLAERSADWHQPWDGWTRTRYEAKALREGRRPCYLRFRRI